MFSYILLAATTTEAATEVSQTTGGVTPGVFVGGAALLITIFSVFFEVSKIPINPISWLGSRLLNSVNKSIDEMKKDVDGNIKDLQNSVEQIRNDQDKYRFATIRWEILSFRTDLYNGGMFTQYEYQHIFDNYKEYEALHAKYGFTNGYIEEAIEDIRNHYKDHKDMNVKHF